MKNLIRKISNLMAEASVFSLGFIMIFVIADIISRYFHRPLYGVTEMAVFAMVITVYLGVPYCEEQEGHVKVEAFLKFLPKKYVKILNLLSYSFVFFVTGILTYSVGLHALSTYIKKTSFTGVVPYPLYPVVFITFLCCIIYWMQVFINLCKNIRGFKK